MFTSWWTFSGLVLITSQSVGLMQFSGRQPAGKRVLRSYEQEGQECLA